MRQGQETKRGGNAAVDSVHEPRAALIKVRSRVKSQLVMMGFNSTNKLTDSRLIGLELFPSTDIPLSPSHHSAALSDC